MPYRGFDLYCMTQICMSQIFYERVWLILYDGIISVPNSRIIFSWFPIFNIKSISSVIVKLVSELLVSATRVKQVDPAKSIVIHLLNTWEQRTDCCTSQDILTQKILDQSSNKSQFWIGRFQYLDHDHILLLAPTENRFTCKELTQYLRSGAAASFFAVNKRVLKYNPTIWRSENR